MWLKELFSKLRDYFYRLFHPVIFNLNEEYDDILKRRNEISKRNVLIGTVRRREQLSINLAHRFYHIPMSELITAEDIEYVAIYQSKNMFHENNDVNGIVYYGRVINAHLVKRSQIPEIHSGSSEMYMRFDVESWQRIEPHIQIREMSPQVSLKTSIYQFSNARFTNELFFNTVDEYVFFLGTIDIINEIYDGFILNSFKVVRRGNKIVVNCKGYKQVFHLSQLSSKPYSTINKIFENT